MEGKEARFGIAASALFATVTTGTSCGAVNSMHDSFTPLGGFVPLFQMQLGEVVFGGVGTGLYSMLIFAIIGVFIAGLMIGRTPEYLGKKIEAFEMKMSSIAILVMPFIVLVGTAVAVSEPAARPGVANPGAHGFSEILYAFTSAGKQQRQRLRGICPPIPPSTTRRSALVMWVGRYWPIVAVLAIAGSLAAKKTRARDRRHHAHARPDLCHPAYRHGAARRCAHLRAGPRAGPGCRASDAVGALEAT